MSSKIRGNISFRSEQIMIIASGTPPQTKSINEDITKPLVKIQNLNNLISNVFS